MRKRLPLIGLALAALVLRLLAYKLMAIPFGGMATAMCQYDCGWYMRIAQDGYGADSEWANFGSLPHWAFFPLFPLVLRAALAIGPWFSASAGPYLIGMLLTNALFLAFVLLGGRYLERTRPGINPAMWVIFAAIAPFSFVFSAVYSESLFSLILVGAMLMLAQKRLLACAALTALLCAARPTGVLMLVPLGIACALDLWRGWNSADRITLLGKTMLPIAIAPLGLSLYMAWQYLQTGDAMAFNHVQILWDRAWHGPLHVLSEGLRAWDWVLVLRPKDAPSQSYDAAWALLGLGIAGWLAFQRRWAEAWMLTGTILLPAATGLHSLPRFVATSPFFMFAVAEMLSKLRHPTALAGCFAALGLWQGVMVVFWFIAANVTY